MDFYSCEQILRKGIFKQGQNDFVLVSQWRWILELNNGKTFRGCVGHGVILGTLLHIEDVSGPWPILLPSSCYPKIAATDFQNTSIERY